MKIWGFKLGVLWGLKDDEPMTMCKGNYLLRRTTVWLTPQEDLGNVISLNKTPQPSISAL